MEEEDRIRKLDDSQLMPDSERWAFVSRFLFDVTLFAVSVCKHKNCYLLFPHVFRYSFTLSSAAPDELEDASSPSEDFALFLIPGSTPTDFLDKDLLSRTVMHV